MKLLYQSDDYGITRAVSRGIIYAITDGVVRNTGLFANMPWTAEVVEWIRPYLDQIAFGIDLNASTGSSLLGYDKVPDLCHPDGSFYTSRENRKLDETAPDHDHVNYDQVLAEFTAQTEKFIELVGRKPDYVHSHAYGTKTTEKARQEIARMLNRPYTGDVKKLANVKWAGYWYKMGDPITQMDIDPLHHITSDQGGMLSSEYGYVISHCGYCDRELFELSSFNTCRVMDLSAATSPEMKDWIEQNHIELVTFKDVKF